MESLHVLLRKLESLRNLHKHSYEQPPASLPICQLDDFLNYALSCILLQKAIFQFFYQTFIVCCDCCSAEPMLIKTLPLFQIFYFYLPYALTARLLLGKILSSIYHFKPVFIDSYLTINFFEFIFCSVRRNLRDDNGICNLPNLLAGVTSRLQHCCFAEYDHLPSLNVKLFLGFHYE